MKVRTAKYGLWTLLGLLLLSMAVLSYRHSKGLWPAQAVADTQQPDVKQVLLPKDMRLKEATWHCWAGGSCELWYLLKPRKADEKPETYVFTNADGSRQYVIKEQ